MRAITVMLFSVLFVSCGKNAMPWDAETVYVDSTEPAVAEEYSYELGNRSCSTGTHSFLTMQEVCSALLDNDLNNNCVENKRLELFESNCGGVSV